MTALVVAAHDMGACGAATGPGASCTDLALAEVTGAGCMVVGRILTTWLWPLGHAGPLELLVPALGPAGDTCERRRQRWAGEEDEGLCMSHWRPRPAGSELLGCGGRGCLGPGL